jgi:hypothetical protein
MDNTLIIIVQLICNVYNIISTQLYSINGLWFQ